ncbi:LysM peptidoglycan-binding domain-containing protein [Sphingomonas sp. SFZ2018-12]|uniref:LysM peptidoglycan-binding domain-containing protein n=1 Tax=Sphingomonas sp. SFZ2018-12 TaxID=2683197 RepID=UPI001F1106BD|nr:LysM peptidoglycan-binding domain-containing protein [Sphingomonas sp. SFZ2018-12]MCH4894797.1 LysM peptidoglycan-binding domain-containing protein [Sphingomonas sp. SFZ2018-12]
MVGAIAAREGQSLSASAPPPPPAIHRIAPGETLSAIAARHGTDVATLAAINGIRDPDRIRAGDDLVLPDGAGRNHVVQQGDTLGAIARRAGVGIDGLLAANPQIANPDRIYPGDVLRIPVAERPAAASPAHAGAVAPVAGTTRVENGTLTLSAADIVDLKKTLQTEWVQSAGDAQAHGIIDTILNRTVSGRWGDSVADVVNAYNQFSDINGPVSRRDGRNSVDDIPASRISARVDQLVDSYLAERAAGRASSIGSHLNYANPNYSSANNLGWIMALDGPVLGRGDAIHRHGTVPELQRYRPGDYVVALPGAAEPSPLRKPPGAFDGRRLAAEAGVAIKEPGVRIDRLASEMAPAIRAVAQAAERLGLPTPVITSGNDSRHGTASLHYSNEALDFRGNNISVAQGHALRDEVQRILGDRYDVLFETFANASNNHLHVEFDPD